MYIYVRVCTIYIYMHMCVYMIYIYIYICIYICVCAHSIYIYIICVYMWKDTGEKTRLTTGNKIRFTPTLHTGKKSLRICTLNFFAAESPYLILFVQYVQGFGT